MKMKSCAPCPSCDFLGPPEPRQLSDQVAVEIYEFLMSFVSDFLGQYGTQINRYNEQRYQRDCADQLTRGVRADDPAQ